MPKFIKSYDEESGKLQCLEYQKSDDCEVVTGFRVEFHENGQIFYIGPFDVDAPPDDLYVKVFRLAGKVRYQGVMVNGLIDNRFEFYNI